MNIDINKTETRGYSADVSAINEESRTVTLSFSSEAPVKRSYGSEVLSHAEGAVNLERMGTAPLLWNHNTDIVLGKVINAFVENGRGYAAVKWSTRTEAQGYWNDVKDGILSNISVGYQIDKYEPILDGKKTVGIRATSWKPYEISLLGVPADNSVGIGRSLEEDPEPIVEEVAERAEEVYAANLPSIEVATEQKSIITMEENITDIRAQELARMKAINSLGTQFKVPQTEINQMIEGDKSIDEVRGIILDRLSKNQAPAINAGVQELGLSQKEQKSYSLVNLVRAAAAGRPETAGLEFEAHRALLNSGIVTKENGYLVPFGDLTMRAPNYLAQTAAQGGNLVATELHSDKYIDYLYNQAKVVALGATVLTGLQGNIQIPKQNGASTTYWVNPEGSDVTDSAFTFSQVPMTPKVLGARAQYSYLAIQQPTLDIESLIRADFAKQIALAMDLAAINGTGASGQPLGILGQAGTNTVALGTNGAALTYAKLLECIKNVEAANALIGTAGWLINTKTKFSLMNTLKSSADTASNFIMTEPGNLLGYRAETSEQVPGNLTKGSGTALSALVFGVWSELYIGQWSTAEMLVNPYGAGYNSGSIDIRIMATMDVAVRHPQSFSKVVDAVSA